MNNSFPDFRDKYYPCYFYQKTTSKRLNLNLASAISRSEVSYNRRCNAVKLVVDSTVNTSSPKPEGFTEGNEANVQSKKNTLRFGSFASFGDVDIIRHFRRFRWRSTGGYSNCPPSGNVTMLLYQKTTSKRLNSNNRRWNAVEPAAESIVCITSPKGGEQ